MKLKLERGYKDGQLYFTVSLLHRDGTLLRQWDITSEDGARDMSCFLTDTDRCEPSDGIFNFKATTFYIGDWVEKTFEWQYWMNPFSDPIDEVAEELRDRIRQVLEWRRSLNISETREVEIDDDVLNLSPIYPVSLSVP